MLGFNDKFQVHLNIRKDEFADRLLGIIDMRYSNSLEFMPNKNQPFLGEVSSNGFKLKKNKSILSSAVGTITGNYETKNDNLEINGRIEGYLFGLGSIVIYVTFCIIYLLSSILFSEPEDFFI